MNIIITEKTIKKIIGERDIKDYTYSILFLLISAFFALFAIKPALTTAFTLQKEVTELQKTNLLYENIIKRVIVVQQEMQEVRNYIPLLNEAVTNMPDIKNLIEDINDKAKSKGFIIEKMQISPLKFKEVNSQGVLRSYTLTMETLLNYDQFDYLRKEMLKDIRIKLIKELSLKKTQLVNASQSAQLQTRIVFDIYYY
jgi:Tfp pilus assembly protein PilO